MALSDDLATHVAFTYRLWQVEGTLERLRLAGRLEVGQAAKAVGVTGEQLRMLERGELAPSNGQAVAHLRVLLAVHPARPRIVSDDAS